MVGVAHIHTFGCLARSPIAGKMHEPAYMDCGYPLGPQGQALLDAYNYLEGLPEYTRPSGCTHDRLNEDGICRTCGVDRRGI
jgi:hypothetical protein